MHRDRLTWRALQGLQGTRLVGSCPHGQTRLHAAASTALPAVQACGAAPVRSNKQACRKPGAPYDAQQNNGGRCATPLCKHELGHMPLAHIQSPTAGRYACDGGHWVRPQ